MLSWNVFTMNQKTPPTSRRNVRWISTTSSGPDFVRRASALGMEETLPHFALGKSANLLAIAASPAGTRGRCFGSAGIYVAHMAPATGACLERETCLKPFDISQASAL